MNKNVLKFGLLALCSTGLIAKAQTMTDPQITQLMKTANEAEIDMAKVAKSKTDNKQVKDFAKMMIDDHEKNEKDDKKVAKEIKVKPEETDTSKSMKKDSEQKISDLKKLKGKDFDKAYIDEQVTMHQALLDDLNQKLIPAAQSPDLKNYLETTKTHVEEHLSKAKEIQTSLTK